MENQEVVFFEEDDNEAAEEPDLESQLHNFRQQWKRELVNPTDQSSLPTDVEEKATALESNGNQQQQIQNGNFQRQSRNVLEERAADLYLQGVNAEKRGQVYEAIKYYRQAMQIAPEIESKIGYLMSEEKNANTFFPDSSGEVDEFLELTEKFLNLTTKMKSYCEPHLEQMSTHISVLPMELIVTLFRWVVSNDMDMRSLEQLSMVCRGFYLCARDPEIWKSACLMIWGPSCCLSKEFPTWRTMYIERPHLQFNGLYISKASYIRQGEQSLDLFSRPWHLVEYYRYIRVFPEGLMLMLTSPDDPLTVIPKLRSRKTKIASIMSGPYKIVEDRVTAVLQKENPKEYDYTSSYRYKYMRNQYGGDSSDREQTFHLDLGMQGSKKRLHSKLVWNHYSCCTTNKLTGNSTIAQFEMDSVNYGPFYFSRVKSYSMYSHLPL